MLKIPVSKLGLYGGNGSLPSPETSMAIWRLSGEKILASVILVIEYGFSEAEGKSDLRLLA
jgi:hypothetical protein